LIKEDKAMADKYKNKSLAEQHSLDTCWDLLMAEGQFEALRGCLFTTASEMKRFRQVMVNVVLATDIFDKELNELRKNRWSKAFDPACTLSENESTDLRATIVVSCSFMFYMVLSGVVPSGVLFANLSIYLLAQYAD